MARASKSKAKHEGANAPPDNPSNSLIPAAEAFSFLRETRGLSTWAPRDVSKSLNISAADARQVIAVLELQGYVKSAGPDQWMTTIAGEEVSGSKTPRFTRERIQKALADLRRQIGEVNASRKASYTIVQAVAFGDFLRDGARVQPADVGVELKRKGSGTADFASAMDHKAQSTFLKQLRGTGGAVTVKPYEKWMSERTHKDLL